MLKTTDVKIKGHTVLMVKKSSDFKKSGRKMMTTSLDQI
jgi:hypothetical protein